MIELAKAQVRISTSPEDVFHYVSNMENYGQWFPGVVAIRAKNKLPHATVGKTYVETLNLPDGEHALTIEVVQCRSDRLFLTQGDLPGVLPQMTVTLSPQEANTCLLTVEYHSRNTDLTDTSDLVVALRRDLADRAQTGVIRLKEILESRR